MYHLWDLEEQLEQTRRRSMTVTEHTRERERERMAIIDQLQAEGLGVRSWVASALVQLGVKLHPKAAEVVFTAEEAA